MTTGIDLELFVKAFNRAREFDHEFEMYNNGGAYGNDTWMVSMTFCLESDGENVVRSSLHVNLTDAINQCCDMGDKFWKGYHEEKKAKIKKKDFGMKRN